MPCGRATSSAKPWSCGRPTIGRSNVRSCCWRRPSGAPASSTHRSGRLAASSRRTDASPRAYVTLAETLEERHRYQDVADVLAPAVDACSGATPEPEGPLSMLLPHLGFAYQQLGQFDKAIAALQEAHKVTGGDPAVAVLSDPGAALGQDATAMPWRWLARRASNSPTIFGWRGSRPKDCVCGARATKRSPCSSR